MMPVFGSRGFKGQSAHPRSLRWLGLLTILCSVGCIGVGIANTMTRVMANQNSLPFTKASVAIWTPIPMFVTGLLTSNVAAVVNASKRWTGMLAFMSCFMFSIVLIGVTSVEFVYNQASSLDNSLPTAILALGCVLFLTTFLITMIIYFCTYAEEAMPLVEEPLPPPTAGIINTMGYTEPPNVGYKVMPLIPSYTLPPAQTFATNIPSAYSRFPVFT